jgi:GT2 family glycosyltransferase
MNRSPQLWVVLVNYNGLADTRKCLHSLRGVAYCCLSVVVVDNASREDPTPALRREFPECHLVRNAINSGWAGGNNAGAVYALKRGADQVLLLNNDTAAAPRLADALLTAVAARPEYGILGPVIYYMDEPAEVMTDGCLFNRPRAPGFFQRKPVPLGRAGLPRVTDVDIVNGCAMMIGAHVFRRIGLIDERFFLIHEEADFCLRARQAGFRCGVLDEGLVWHKGSSSFKRTGSRLQRYYDTRNLYLLLKKHTGSHRAGRGPLPGYMEYVKYSYYRYALEREAGHADAADAVLEGLCDALTRRYGPFASRSRPAVPWLRWAFEAWRGYRRTRSANRDNGSHALTVH